MAFNDFNDPSRIYHMFFHDVNERNQDVDSTGWVRPSVGWRLNCYPIGVEAPGVRAGRCG